MFWIVLWGLLRIGGVLCFRALEWVAFFFGKFRNGAHFLCECAWGCIGCEVWGKGSASDLVL